MLRPFLVYGRHMVIKVDKTQSWQSGHPVGNIAWPGAPPPVATWGRSITIGSYGTNSSGQIPQLLRML